VAKETLNLRGAVRAPRPTDRRSPAKIVPDDFVMNNTPEWSLSRLFEIDMAITP
jgi:hypothetical protein